MPEDRNNPRSNSIIRTSHDKDNPYVMLNKAIFEEASLSPEAVGVWAYLMSKPDDWQTYFWEVARRWRLGRNKLQRVFRELESTGYISRQRAHREDGTFHYITTVYETPQTPAVTKKSPLHRKPLTAEPLTDNLSPYLVSSKPSNEHTNKRLNQQQHTAVDIVNEAYDDEILTLHQRFIERWNCGLPKRYLALLREKGIDFESMMEAMDEWDSRKGIDSPPAVFKQLLNDWNDYKG